MFPIPCILFAGGKSSRMGEDKSLLPFGKFSTLAEFQYERLKNIFSRVYISTKSSNKFGFSADFILDPQEVDYAPTAGFVSAFRALRDERIMVLSVDTPFVEKAVFQILMDADNDDLDAVIARTHEGVHPLCGIYHRSLLGEFERMLEEGDHRLGKLLASSRTQYIDFEREEPFMNLNHPHEYQKALKYLEL
ncbi:MAG: molybdenum cofactor guanylyltransferase MobA [Sulfuricurvum sp.]|uniref:molybdenum cofactor guanylyltransferase MobA n=1 Tax=Sulfuricurvum sp. TaxID=2025608 RepID=UPI0025F9BCE0|nr:molybdenum cofactor guanylyltransferase MobA [Sulfuricurvum sp.]MBV5321202.1 molybdenum cofactor guanylyltransferase MobA [Sulfuricurvum sp.]